MSSLHLGQAGLPRLAPTAHSHMDWVPHLHLATAALLYWALTLLQPYLTHMVLRDTRCTPMHQEQATMETVAVAAAVIVIVHAGPVP